MKRNLLFTILAASLFSISSALQAGITNHNANEGVTMVSKFTLNDAQYSLQGKGTTETDSTSGRVPGRPR